MGFFDEYPYTNWHNVNLDWVLERVKEWGQMVIANDQAFKDLEEANASFKAYVENYLQDLDVQEAIDDKLDRMFESGVLGEYLQPYVSPAVTTWLEENITEPEGVVIDSSLTVAGAAADAKAAGDRINDLLPNIVPESIRRALYFLLNACAYDERVYISADVSANLSTVQAWAGVTIPIYQLESAFVSNGNNQFDTGFAFQRNYIYTICFDLVVSSANVDGPKAIFSNRPAGAVSKYSEMAIERKSASSTALVYWGYGIRYDDSQNNIHIGDRVRAVAIIDVINYKWEQTFKNVTRNITRHFTRDGNLESIITGTNIYLGASAGNTVSGFVGTVNEFTIYNREFSSTEINIYLNGV